MSDWLTKGQDYISIQSEARRQGMPSILPSQVFVSSYCFLVDCTEWAGGGEGVALLLT